MPEYVDPIVFCIFATVTIGFAVAMFVVRSVIHECFMLLGVTVGIAGLYLTMNYSFLALVSFLIYSGAVSILLVFTIMITRRRGRSDARNEDFSVPALVTAVVFCSFVLVAIFAWVFPEVAPRETVLSLSEIGEHLYSLGAGWAFPFELASLVLLTALVGAIWWTKGGDE